MEKRVEWDLIEVCWRWSTQLSVLRTAWSRWTTRAHPLRRQEAHRRSPWGRRSVNRPNHNTTKEATQESQEQQRRSSHQAQAPAQHPGHLLRRGAPERDRWYNPRRT